MKKTIKCFLIVGTAVVLLFVGFGVKSIADSVWAGHQNVAQTKADIDTLAHRIQEKKYAYHDSGFSIKQIKPRLERCEK